jgi:hypothetical protein
MEYLNVIEVIYLIYNSNIFSIVKIEFFKHF